MAKKSQIMAVIFCVFMSNIVSAGGPETTEDKAGWAPEGSFYLTGGYEFSHAFYDDTTLSLAPPQQPVIIHTPESAFPNNFSGIRFGWGSGFGSSKHFAYEFDYSQILTKTKTVNDLKVSKSSKVLVAIVSYTINPQSRFTASLATGALIVSNYIRTATVSPRPFFSQTTNATDIDPFLGGALAYQINPKLAIRLVEFYDFATYNPAAKGAVVTLLMLNFYPG